MKIMSIKLLKQKEIEKILKIKINNPDIWLEAILHKSWFFFHPEYRNLPHNERLEFLGDALLSFYTALYLYENYPELSEGEMSLVKAKLVNRERLGEIGEKLGIEKFLLMTHSIDKKGKRTILGNSLEAIIGAIFLDCGLDKAIEFIKENILQGVDEIIKNKKFKDPKTTLQEFFQKHYGEIPEYRLLEVTGPAHKQKFKVGIYFKNKKIAEGEGYSKQKAEFSAAIKALENYFK